MSKLTWKLQEKFVERVLKDPESFLIGADPFEGFKKPPVLFQSAELTAVILPVRVGGDQNE